jgi:hypothetical protein
VACSTFGIDRESHDRPIPVAVGQQVHGVRQASLHAVGEHCVTRALQADRAGKRASPAADGVVDQQRSLTRQPY